MSSTKSFRHDIATGDLCHVKVATMSQTNVSVYCNETLRKALIALETTRPSEYRGVVSTLIEFAQSVADNLPNGHDDSKVCDNTDMMMIKVGYIPGTAKDDGVTMLKVEKRIVVPEHLSRDRGVHTRVSADEHQADDLETAMASTTTLLHIPRYAIISEQKMADDDKDVYIIASTNAGSRRWVDDTHDVYYKFGSTVRDFSDAPLPLVRRTAHGKKSDVVLDRHYGSGDDKRDIVGMWEPSVMVRLDMVDDTIGKHRGLTACPEAQFKAELASVLSNGHVIVEQPYVGTDISDIIMVDGDDEKKEDGTSSSIRPSTPPKTVCMHGVIRLADGVARKLPENAVPSDFICLNCRAPILSLEGYRNTGFGNAVDHITANAITNCVERELLRNFKLSLVIDLDETFVHAVYPKEGDEEFASSGLCGGDYSARSKHRGDKFSSECAYERTIDCIDAESHCVGSDGTTLLSGRSGSMVLSPIKWEKFGGESFTVPIKKIRRQQQQHVGCGVDGEIPRSYCGGNMSSTTSKREGTLDTKKGEPPVLDDADFVIIDDDFVAPTTATMTKSRPVVPYSAAQRLSRSSTPRIAVRHWCNEFIKSISEDYRISVCSLGNRAHVDTVMGYIDPEEIIPRYRVMSRDDYIVPRSDWNAEKEVFPSAGPLHLTVILDDRLDVWGTIPNVIEIDKFFGNHDTCLEIAADILQRIHAEYYKAVLRTRAAIASTPPPPSPALASSQTSDSEMSFVPIDTPSIDQRQDEDVSTDKTALSLQKQLQHLQQQQLPPDGWQWKTGSPTDLRIQRMQSMEETGTSIPTSLRSSISHYNPIDVASVMDYMRSNTLAGVVIHILGNRSQSFTSNILAKAQQFGAVTYPLRATDITHFLVSRSDDEETVRNSSIELERMRPGHKRVPKSHNSVDSMGNSFYVIDINWIYDCCKAWKQLSVSHYTYFARRPRQSDFERKFEVHHKQRA